MTGTADAAFGIGGGLAAVEAYGFLNGTMDIPPGTLLISMATNHLISPGEPNCEMAYVLTSMSVSGLDTGVNFECKTYGGEEASDSYCAVNHVPTGENSKFWSIPVTQTSSISVSVELQAEDPRGSFYGCSNISGTFSLSVSHMSVPGRSAE